MGNCVGGQNELPGADVPADSGVAQQPHREGGVDEQTEQGNKN